MATDVPIEDKVIERLATRDALLPVLAVLNLAKKLPLSTVTECLPNRFTYSDRLKGIAKELSAPLIALGTKDPKKLLDILNLNGNNLKSINSIDGLRLTFTNEDIVHIRASGNAPELRCYSESCDIKKAKALVINALNSIKKQLAY